MQTFLNWLRVLFVPTLHLKKEPDPEPVAAVQEKSPDLADRFEMRFIQAGDTIAQVRSGRWSGTPLVLYFQQSDAYTQFLQIALGRLKNATSLHLPSKKKRTTLSKFFTDANHFYVDPKESHASLARVFCEFVREHTRLSEETQTRLMTTRESNNLSVGNAIIMDIEEYLQTLGV